MVVGLGVDIVQKIRIKSLINNYGFKFIEKIFSEKEIQSKRMKYYIGCDPELKIEKGIDYNVKLSDLSQVKLESFVSFVSRRFAAKEAVSKAIGCGLFGKDLSFIDIQIDSNARGAPSVVMTKRVINAILKSENIHKLVVERSENGTINPNSIKLSISISDEKDNAVCIAIIDYIEKIK